MLEFSQTFGHALTMCLVGDYDLSRLFSTGQSPVQRCELFCFIICFVVTDDSDNSSLIKFLQENYM